MKLPATAVRLLPDGRPDPIGSLISLADVEAEQVSWLWSGRIPLGKLTVLDGDPGLGKSTLTTELAARLSRGLPMPGHEGEAVEAAGTLFLAAEDGLGDTARPRAEAAGADLRRIFALPMVGDRMPNLADVEALREAARRSSAKLIVIDPLMAYLEPDTNSHKDQDIRRALSPIAALAEELGAAVVIVRHLNKASGPTAIYRGGGSIGIIGAARSALLLAKDPQDANARILASNKSNLGPPPASLRFKLAKRFLDSPAASIEWLGESSLNANDLVSAPPSQHEQGALEDAESFLRQVLSDGPLEVAEVKAAAKDAGIAFRTIERAKAGLGVKAGKLAFNSPWRWSLPPEDRQPQTLAAFDEMEPKQ